MSTGRDGVVAGSDVDDVLIASLLAPPVIPSDILARRPRLRDLLTRSADGPLVLITGEPAAGKTTLVASWLAEGSAGTRPVAWLTARSINDEVMLWRYVLASLGVFGIEYHDLRSALLDDERPNDAWLTVLANRVSAVEGRPLLVIDDLHEITRPSALESLRAFLDRLGPSVTCVFTSRSTPPWPLSTWRMSGRMRTIGSHDLRFTEREVVELVELLGDIELSESDVARLVQRTEGWAGGVKLALLALRRSDDPSSDLARFVADDETMSTYLVRDVLDRQEPDVREFLLDAALLEEFSAEVCDAVLERTDSGELLEHCRNEHLFLANVDGEGNHQRFHQLFAALLRARREADDPERSVDIHRRASLVYEARSDIRRAVVHAAAAGDDRRVGLLVAHHVTDFAQRGLFEEIRGWLTVLTPEASADLPESTFGLLLALILSDRADDALAAIDRLERSTITPRLHYGLDQLRGFAYMLRGDLERLTDVASVLERDVPPGDTALPFDEVRLQAYLDGVGHYFAGDLDRSVESLERACRRRERPGLFFAESPGWGALAAVGRGRLGDAEVLGRESLDRQRMIGTGETAVVVPGRLALALVAWERDDLALCRDQLAIARRSVRPLLWEAVVVECAASRSRASDGEIDAAIADLLDVGKVFLRNDAAPNLYGMVADRLADLYLRAGDTGSAELWMRNYHEFTGRPARPSLRVRMAHAGAARDAREIADAALSDNAAMPERLDTLLAVAVLQCDLGDRGAALTGVGRAASLAAPEGHLRRFCDAGPTIMALVRELHDDPALAPDVAVSPFFLAGILDAASEVPATSRRPAPVVVGLVEQLSEREHEVLSLLEHEANYSNIGRQLFVSRNTVKSHIQHIYTKLGVSSRDSAVTEAQRLGLL